MNSTERRSFRGIPRAAFLWSVVSVIFLVLAIHQLLRPHLAIGAVLSQVGMVLVAVAQLINTRLGRMERGGQALAHVLMLTGAPRRVDRLSAWIAVTFSILGLLGVAAGLILIVAG